MTDNQDENPDERKISFDFTANDPDAWLHYADNLLLSSDILRERMGEMRKPAYPPDQAVPERVHGVDLMLRAFALEGFLKGLRLRLGIPMARDGELVGATHNLEALYDAAGLPALEKAQRDVLKKLERYATHWGRYPVASNHQRQQWTPGTGMIWYGTEDEIADELISLVRAKLTE